METIEITRDARGVATLTLARPEKHNAMSAQMIAELREAAAMLGADPAVRVVMLTGQGRSFCAGGDLGWMQAQMAADAKTRAEGARALAGMLGALDRMPKPLVGRIQGNAFGGGVGLACVCDVAIAAQGARFGLTETKLGLIPATIGPYVLRRLGPRARAVFMSPRLFDAAEAVRLGVVHAAVEDLDAAIEAQVAPYLTAAPGAVASAKALARTVQGEVTEAEVEASIAALIARWEDAEARAGIEAFFAKRPPPWNA